MGNVFLPVHAFKTRTGPFDHVERESGQYL